MNYKGGRPKCKKCNKDLEYKSKIFLCRKHYLENKKGKSALHWKGGIKNNNGYVMVYKPEHPKCDQQGYVREHRLVVEKHLGRYLKSDEIIHHINHKRNDNRFKNLKIMTKTVHDKIHLASGEKTRFKKGQTPWNKQRRKNV